jgi:hypothetical protein
VWGKLISELVAFIPKDLREMVGLQAGIWLFVLTPMILLGAAIAQEVEEAVARTLAIRMLVLLLQSAPSASSSIEFHFLLYTVPITGHHVYSGVNKSFETRRRCASQRECYV